MFPEDLKISVHKEEEVFEMKKEYPYVIRKIAPFLGPGVVAPWHWHRELELVVIKTGMAEYYTLDKKVVLHKGEGVFINGNVLHQVTAPKASAQLQYHVHMFHKDFIAPPKSLIDTKYLSPFLQCNEISIVHLRQENPEQSFILEQLEHLSQLEEEGNVGYELVSRNIISEIMLELFKAQADVIQNSGGVSPESESRLKPMLLFIQEHYMDSISLREIAEAAHIGERECLRCFQKMLHISPFNYLQAYRVQAACGLLRFTTDSIMTIAMKTGFSSGSYFGKTFRKHMNCTPNEYRKRGT